MKAFSRTVADALHGRDHLTDEAFGAISPATWPAWLHN